MLDFRIYFMLIIILVQSFEFSELNTTRCFWTHNFELCSILKWLKRKQTYKLYECWHNTFLTCFSFGFVTKFHGKKTSIGKTTLETKDIKLTSQDKSIDDKISVVQLTKTKILQDFIYNLQNIDNNKKQKK